MVTSRRFKSVELCFTVTGYGKSEPGVLFPEIASKLEKPILYRRTTSCPRGRQHCDHLFECTMHFSKEA